MEPGHAAVRYVNPTTRGDVLPTLRADIRRLRPGTRATPRREVGSSVVQVFDGSGRVTVGEHGWTDERGDLFVVPSWEPFAVETEQVIDLFRFSDTPVFEALHQHRVQVGEAGA